MGEMLSKSANNGTGTALKPKMGHSFKLLDFNDSLVSFKYDSHSIGELEAKYMV